MNRIATILTCHNRCAKTVASLKSLVASLNKYNNENNEQIYIEVFLTDDGCTDCTVSKVNKYFASIIPVHIIPGDGNRFWAGGMRDAWSEAQKQEWDYYLLLNDDTVVKDNVFSELLNTHIYCLEHYSKEGVYSGITCIPGDETQITYGGEMFGPINFYANQAFTLQIIHRCVIYSMLIFCWYHSPLFIILEYSTISMLMALRTMIIQWKQEYHDIPVLITANVCGECENDHPDADVVEKVFRKMSLLERIHFFKNPLHSSSDYLYFVRRFAHFDILLHG